MDINLLKKMYMINSYSGKEQELSLFVQEQLKKMKIPFQTDNFHQIFSINKNTPLLSAHLDQVGQKKITRIIEKNGFIFSNENLGADDKNGVFLILEILKKHPDISFIFSSCEEIGGNCFEVTARNKIEDCLYCLVLDRKGSSDIIGTKNGYCSISFEKDILKIGKQFGYKSNDGIFSDANHLSNFLSCINLSVGYYNPHSKHEYASIKDLKNAYNFIDAIISKINKKYKAPKNTFFF